MIVARSKRAAKEKPYICDLCQHSFRQKQLLRRHINIHHTPGFEPPPPKKKTYICHYCGKSYALKGNLHRHMGLHSESNHKLIGRTCHAGNGNNTKDPHGPKLQQTEQLTDEIKCGDIYYVSDDEQYVVMQVIEVNDEKTEGEKVIGQLKVQVEEIASEANSKLDHVLFSDHYETRGSDDEYY